MAIVKKKFKITDMDCAPCAISIDFDLEDLEGVKSAKTSYAKGLTEIEFDPTRVKDSIILETIKKSGYTAVAIDS
jgi:P-type Cu+ transporter